MLDSDKYKEPWDKKVFEPWFKHCPNCGGEFVLNEDRGEYMCDGCNGHAFKITNKYYFNYMRWRREQFKEYHHGD